MSGNPLGLIYGAATGKVGVDRKQAQQPKAQQDAALAVCCAEADWTIAVAAWHCLGTYLPLDPSHQGVIR